MVEWEFCGQLRSDTLVFHHWSYQDVDISGSDWFKIEVIGDATRIPLTTRILVTRYYPEYECVYTPARRVFIRDTKIIFTLPAPQRVGNTTTSSVLAVRKSRRGFPRFSVEYFWLCNVYRAINRGDYYIPIDVPFGG